MSRRVPSRRVKLTMAMAVLTTALILALPAAAYAKTWHVSTTGNDTTGNGSVGSPYATVQHAVGGAASGDVVQVGPGTFSGDITMKNGVSLQGAGAKETTLTASGISPVVAFSNIGTTTSISGVAISGNNKGDGIDCDNSSPTITNDIIGGNSSYGIYCDNSSSPTITNDTITGNSYSGIYCYNASPTITNDTISGNSNNGIYCYNSSPTITNDTITGNIDNGIYCDNSSPNITNGTISGNAYGIDCETSSSPTITNDTISGNDYNIYCDSSSPTITNDTISDGYDGIDCNYSSPVITNDTISGNAYGIDCMNGSSPTITNCIVWDSGSSDLTSCTATYSDISSVVAGTGNISADPSFVDTAAGDFHLNAGSPCIDAGTSAGAPATDKDGVPRPQGNGYDMGAYEYHPLTCQLHYTAGSGGSIVGSSTQVVILGSSGTTVTAKPAAGYHFVSWSDGVLTAVRADKNVEASHTVTATFAFTLLKTKLTITSNKTTATRGTTVAFSGTISPHMPNGTHVAVQICKSGSSTWTTMSTRSTFSSYHWSYGYKIPKTHAKGTYYVRVRYAGSTKYLSCVSGNRKLVIK